MTKPARIAPGETYANMTVVRTELKEVVVRHRIRVAVVRCRCGREFQTKFDVIRQAVKKGQEYCVKCSPRKAPGKDFLKELRNRQIRERVAAGASYKQVAKEFDLTPMRIYQIYTNKGPRKRARKTDDAS